MSDCSQPVRLQRLQEKPQPRARARFVTSPGGQGFLTLPCLAGSRGRAEGRFQGSASRGYPNPPSEGGPRGGDPSPSPPLLRGSGKAYLWIIKETEAGGGHRVLGSNPRSGHRGLRSGRRREVIFLSALNYRERGEMGRSGDGSVTLAAHGEVALTVGKGPLSIG